MSSQEDVNKRLEACWIWSFSPLWLKLHQTIPWNGSCAMGNIQNIKKTAKVDELSQWGQQRLGQFHNISELIKSF